MVTFSNSIYVSRWIPAGTSDEEVRRKGLGISNNTDIQRGYNYGNPILGDHRWSMPAVREVRVRGLPIWPRVRGLTLDFLKEHDRDKKSSLWVQAFLPMGLFFPSETSTSPKAGLHLNLPTVAITDTGLDQCRLSPVDLGDGDFAFRLVNPKESLAEKLRYAFDEDGYLTRGDGNSHEASLDPLPPVELYLRELTVFRKREGEEWKEYKLPETGEGEHGWKSNFNK